MFLNRAVFFLLVFSTCVFGQKTTGFLQKADEAFAQNKWVEAAQYYEKLDAAVAVKNPQLLVKMAHTALQLNESVKACYYLSRALVVNPDTKIAIELEKIANNNGFKGYETGTRNSLILLYKNYISYVLMLLIGIGVFLVYVLITKKLKKEKIGAGQTIFIFLFLLIIWGLNNLEDNYGEVIVKNQETVLRTGPNALGQAAEKVNLGTKLTAIGRSDIWVWVIFDRSIRYIKETDVLLIEK